MWFKERVGKVKMHLERLKKEFPDLPNEPQISFPGVGGLSDDEMTLLGCNVRHEGKICIDNWEAQRRACMITLFLRL